VLFDFQKVKKLTPSPGGVEFTPPGIQLIHRLHTCHKNSVNPKGLKKTLRACNALRTINLTAGARFSNQFFLGFIFVRGNKNVSLIHNMG
jgi:hypothetical protein